MHVKIPFVRIKKSPRPIDSKYIKLFLWHRYCSYWVNGIDKIKDNFVKHLTVCVNESYSVRSKNFRCYDEMWNFLFTFFYLYCSSVMNVGSILTNELKIIKLNQISFTLYLARQVGRGNLMLRFPFPTNELVVLFLFE